MGMDYTQEKLWQAVNTLVGSGSIQTRLRYAAEYLIRVKGRDEHAFPQAELQERFARVMERLTSTPAVGDEGTIQASTRNLTDEDAEKVASEIFSLFCGASELARVPVGFGVPIRTSTH